MKNTMFIKIWSTGHTESFAALVPETSTPFVLANLAATTATADRPTGGRTTIFTQLLVRLGPSGLSVLFGLTPLSTLAAAVRVGVGKQSANIAKWRRE